MTTVLATKNNSAISTKKFASPLDYRGKLDYILQRPFNLFRISKFITIKFYNH